MKKLCLALLIFFTQINSRPQKTISSSKSSNGANSACPTSTQSPLTLEKLYDFKKNSDTKIMEELQKNLSRFEQERIQNQITGFSLAIIAAVALYYFGSPL